MNLRQRLSELEKRVGAGGVPTIHVVRPNSDGTVTVDGETMTVEEHRRRCEAEGIEVISLRWPEQQREEWAETG